MPNPFIELGSPALELQRRRAHRFQIGVYTVLVTMTVFLLGMLIQGCHSEPSGTETSAQQGSTPLASDSATNAAATNAVAATNAGPGVSAPTNAAAPSAPTALTTSELSNTVAAVAPPAPAVTNDTPAPAPKANTPATGVYVVKAGDTLERIAKTHGTTVKAIRAANQLKTDRINVGKKLKLPQTTNAAPAL